MSSEEWICNSLQVSNTCNRVGQLENFETMQQAYINEKAFVKGYIEHKRKEQKILYMSNVVE